MENENQELSQAEITAQDNASKEESAEELLAQNISDALEQIGPKRFLFVLSGVLVRKSGLYSPGIRAGDLTWMAFQIKKMTEII